MILEGAVTWEPLLSEREREKYHKYLELAADLTTQHHGWRVDVVPTVVGCLGTNGDLRINLSGLGLFTCREVSKLCREMQFEVLCSTTHMIRRYLAS